MLVDFEFLEGVLGILDEVIFGEEVQVFGVDISGEERELKDIGKVSDGIEFLVGLGLFGLGLDGLGLDGKRVFFGYGDWGDVLRGEE